MLLAFIITLSTRGQHAPEYPIGWEEKEAKPRNIALDRIASFRKTAVEFGYSKSFDFKGHFNDFVGVTKHDTNPKVIVQLKLTSLNRAQYLITKPIHPTQTHSKDPQGNYIFELHVIPNRELEAKILEFGPDMEVLEPIWLREQVADKVRCMWALYSD
ncbi:WYL domain-containing protein [Dyadobacter jejuensis]|uniref:WYL domain-containing protein n=1 Tax=Dyadobacter jejuensis TaxID=1082580 RepID=A0A316AJM7_9BACT|nr:WYL domain-containing protein [Dyadobacter jejuensis]PWJ57821.1 WYL domain-containing protein [Dyadobacter jejuensis]